MLQEDELSPNGLLSWSKTISPMARGRFEHPQAGQAVRQARQIFPEFRNSQAIQAE